MVLRNDLINHMQKLLQVNSLLLRLKTKDNKSKKLWSFVRKLYKKQRTKLVLRKKKSGVFDNFFFSFFQFLVPLFSFRGNSGFGFKFFIKILLYFKLFFRLDSKVLLFDFLSKLLLPFDFRQKRKSGKALFLPMLINLKSQYSVLFRFFLKRKVRRSQSFFNFFLNTLRNSFLLQDAFYFHHKERVAVAIKHLRFLRFRW